MSSGHVKMNWQLQFYWSLCLCLFSFDSALVLRRNVFWPFLSLYNNSAGHVPPAFIQFSAITDDPQVEACMKRENENSSLLRVLTSDCIKWDLVLVILKAPTKLFVGFLLMTARPGALPMATNENSEWCLMQESVNMTVSNVALKSHLVFWVEEHTTGTFRVNKLHDQRKMPAVIFQSSVATFWEEVQKCLADV